MISVRVANYLDIPQLEQLMYLHWLESMQHSSMVPYDKDICIKNLYQYLVDDGHLFLVAVIDEVLIGYLWLYVAAPHYSDKVYVNEQYLFVHKEWRNSGRALNALLEEAKRATKLLGGLFIQVGTLGGVAKQERAYEKRFKKVGSIYHIPIEGE